MERFLVRVLSNRRLRDAPNTSTFIAESEPCQGGRLTLFLEQHGSNPFLAEDPAQFVDELHRRWLVRSGQSSAAPSAVPSRPAMEDGARGQVVTGVDSTRVSTPRTVVDRENPFLGSSPHSKSPTGAGSAGRGVGCRRRPASAGQRGAASRQLSVG